MLQRHHHISSCAGPYTAPGVSSSLLSRPVATRAPRAVVVLRAGGNGAENGRLTSEKQREIAKILLQTQKNMLELNNSRVKVQEELAMAHRRIADLERELERMRVEQAREQLKKAEQAATVTNSPPALDQGAAPAQAAAAAAAAAPSLSQPLTPSATTQQQQQQQQAPQMPPPPPPQQQQQPQPLVTNHHSPPPQQQQQQVQQIQQQQVPPMQQQQQPMPPQQQQPPAQPAPPAIIDLTYISGWHNCFVHYQVDDKPWTSVPGVRLATSKQDHMIKNIVIQGRKMEFVMTNGENDWDSPGRFAEKPKNYVITGPGTYRLKSGKLEQLS